MQLKRDTEYALRILFTVAGATDPRGITRTEIRNRSGLPRAGVNRICDRLESAGLITCRREDNGEGVYAAAADLFRKSLLDVICAVEQGVPLFAVFEKGSAFFSQNEGRLTTLQGKVEALLDEEKLGDYFSRE